MRPWDDYVWWQEHDRKILKRITMIIKDIVRTPFEGIAKPEPLRANLSGYWSRRINDEHRLIYALQDQDLVIIACRYHYE